MINEPTLLAFSKLFTGRTDVWGGIEGRSNKEPVTEKNYRDHLEGKISLGIYPLLDDGTCNFFALDIDGEVDHLDEAGNKVYVRDFAKALAIRDKFATLMVPAYISESRSKGYHVWVFGAQPMVAALCRQLAFHVLDSVGFLTEVFPKQDKLDSVIPYGNYINIPSFGDTARRFVSREKLYVDINLAVSKIVKLEPAKLGEVVKDLPAVRPLVLSRPAPQTDTKGKSAGKKGKDKPAKHPPCVQMMMKGVGQGARDVGAFALARHLLDQQYIPEEVLGLLMVWDTKNTPPINDQRVIEDKIKSAAKGYAFGCASVQKEPLLGGYCVGADKCDWLQSQNKDKGKKGLVNQTSFYEDDNFIYEEILEGGLAAGTPVFAAFEKATGQIKNHRQIDFPDGRVFIPAWGKEISEGAVTLPTGVAEYGDTLDLVTEVKNLILEYVDMSSVYSEFATWYIFGSWVYDRLNNLSYLRFLGDTGTGKSQALNVVARLCYKPMMMAGAVTPAPIYRLISRFRGTLILEEADIKDSDEQNEVVKILNCGFQRGRPIIRCSQDNPDTLQVLPVFCPKVFATRFKFEDIALEARCLSVKMTETDREDIIQAEGSKFETRLIQLRQKLLLWRFRHLTSIDPERTSTIDVGKVEPRLKQIGRSFALPFVDHPDVMERFREFMQEVQRELITERSDSATGRVVQCIFKLAQSEGVDNITSGSIAKLLGDEYKMEVKDRTVGKILTSLEVKRANRRGAGSRAHYIIWEPAIMKKHLRRYFAPVDIGEFLPLLEGAKQIEPGDLPGEPEPEQAQIDMEV